MAIGIVVSCAVVGGLVAMVYARGGWAYLAGSGGLAALGHLAHVMHLRFTGHDEH